MDVLVNILGHLGDLAVFDTLIAIPFGAAFFGLVLFRKGEKV